MGSNRSTILLVPDDDDDVTLLKICSSTNPNNVISVDYYKGDLQTGIIDLDATDDFDDDEVQILPSSSSPFKQTHSVIEIGESSDTSNSSSNIITTFVCEICVDTKPNSDSFTIMGCTHSYCSDCMVKYVSSKLDQNITQIACPVSDCNNGVLELEHCRMILPPDVFDKWGSALCESLILTSEKFYCPFKDCSALMIDDGGGGGAVAEAECPNCNRLFCARCKVPWHPGIQCSEFQKLNEDERAREDIMLMKLAKEKKWARCPKCKFYVEKSEGCLFILCRCKHTFCYNCGAAMKQHYCQRCKH